MKANKTHLMIVAVVVVAFMGFNGCKKADSEESAEKPAGDSIKLCMGCGQIKGGDLCCNPDQPKCLGCGLAKGSPGCCKIPKDATAAAICAKCGQIKDSESCCKPGQPKCSGCGLTKASPGCCKIPM